MRWLLPSPDLLIKRLKGGALCIKLIALFGYQNGGIKPQPVPIIVDYLGFCELVAKPLDGFPINAENLCGRAKIKPGGFRSLHTVDIVN